MNATGVPLPQIRHPGGWAADSSAVLDYIDPTVTPSAASRWLWRWLLPVAHAAGTFPHAIPPPPGDL
eukprot:CAMPEP_0117649424 /NCGR_PEP_ID=MMETSP0804-20121206/965_1 /TAXON_ID=1074897 /ORGANISM="Tetraselmis astigmatica, Strain CCMP880" /LENGTH=66 /DNA_ID=CAMNT_0005455161 /DNA_START=94 /DNA_END=294 /DNA_ORIENTATION=-